MSNINIGALYPVMLIAAEGITVIRSTHSLIAVSLVVCLICFMLYYVMRRKQLVREKTEEDKKHHQTHHGFKY